MIRDLKTAPGPDRSGSVGFPEHLTALVREPT